MRDLSELSQKMEKCNFTEVYEDSNEFPSVNCLTGEGRKRGKQTAAAK